MAESVGQLEIKLSLNSKEFNADIEGVKEKADGVGERFMNAGKVVGAAFAAAAAATSVAIGKIAADAVKAYADYEQLVGGVETLFKESSGIVQEYANNSFQTAGLSANDYMETVTSFSASLLQGLGGDTKAAADMANVAVTDMADNANKMGTDIARIQDAYQGFAKQNYTMLDNLKLGYGGTQAEMARLINDSGVLGDTMQVTAETVNSVSFDKMVQAIHVVQERMGITGTTAKEAADTISGSVNTMKAAWTDMLVSIAGGGKEFGRAMDDLIKSAGNVIKNLIPVLSKSLQGIGQLVVEIAPIISAELPGLIATLVPQLVEAATQLIIGIAQALPGLVTTLVNAILEVLPTLIDGLITAVMALLDAIIAILSDPNSIQMLVDSALILLMGIIDAIPKIVDALTVALPVIITNIVDVLTKPDTINQILLAGIKLFMALVEAIPKVIGALVSALGSILSTIVNNIGTWVVQVVAKGYEVGMQFVGKVVEFFTQLPGKIGEFLLSAITNVANWVSEMIQKAIEVGGQFLQNIVDFFTQLPGKIWDFLTDAIGKVGSFVTDMGAKALEAGQSFFDNLVNKVQEIPSKMLEIGKNIVEGIWNGISGAAQWLWDQVSGFCSSIVDNIKSFFGIESPSKLFRDQVGVYLAKGIGVGFSDEMGSVSKAMQNVLSKDVAALSAEANIDANLGTPPTTATDNLGSWIGSLSNLAGDDTTTNITGSTTTINQTNNIYSAFDFEQINDRLLQEIRSVA